MTIGKPSALVRMNQPNAVRVKKRLSLDYTVRTKNLGEEAFRSLAKSVRATKWKKPSAGKAMFPREKALQVFAHHVSNGDHTLMARLAQAAPNERSRRRLIAWFERVGHLKWDEHRQRFIGKPDRSKLSMIDPASASVGRAATGSPHKTRNYRPVTRVAGNRCKVCDHPAMPGEDTCYSHQSG